LDIISQIYQIAFINLTFYYKTFHKKIPPYKGEN